MAETEIVQAEEATQDLPEGSTDTAEQQPEPAAGEVTTEGETGAEPSGETQETQTEDTDDNWLPTEQAKVYPVSVLQEYAAKRFPNLSQDLIAKDLGVQELLKGKLDADIYIRSQNQQSDEGLGEVDELGEFLGEDAQLPEPETEAQPATATQADPRAVHYQLVDQVLGQVDPKVTEELGRNVLAAFQVDVDPKVIAQAQATVRNPNATPEQRQNAQMHLDLVNNSGKLGGTLGRAALDLMATALPALLPQFIEQVYPGSQMRYQKGVVADSWEQIRRTTGKDQKPLIPGLPSMGTPEFAQLVERAEKRNGWPRGAFETVQFTDPRTGQPLPFERNARVILNTIARAAAGQGASPAVTQQLLQTATKQVQKRAQTIAAGRALGSGQPTSSGGGGSGNDDIFGPGLAEYKRRGG